jgi:hypothetical protein
LQPSFVFSYKVPNVKSSNSVHRPYAQNIERFVVVFNNLVYILVGYLKNKLNSDEASKMFMETMIIDFTAMLAEEALNFQNDTAFSVYFECLIYGRRISESPRGEHPYDNFYKYHENAERTKRRTEYFFSQFLEAVGNDVNANITIDRVQPYVCKTKGLLVGQWESLINESDVLIAEESAKYYQIFKTFMLEEKEITPCDESGEDYDVSFTHETTGDNTVDDAIQSSSNFVQSSSSSTSGSASIKRDNYGIVKLVQTKKNLRKSEQSEPPRKKGVKVKDATRREFQPRHIQEEEDIDPQPKTQFLFSAPYFITLEICKARVDGRVPKNIITRKEETERSTFSILQSFLPYCCNLHHLLLRNFNRKLDVELKYEAGIRSQLENFWIYGNCTFVKEACSNNDIFQCLLEAFSPDSCDENYVKNLLNKGNDPKTNYKVVMLIIWQNIAAAVNDDLNPPIQIPLREVYCNCTSLNIFSAEAATERKPSLEKLCSRSTDWNVLWTEIIQEEDRYDYLEKDWNTYKKDKAKAKFAQLEQVPDIDVPSIFSPSSILTTLLKPHVTSFNETITILEHFKVRIIHELNVVLVRILTTPNDSVPPYYKYHLDYQRLSYKEDFEVWTWHCIMDPSFTNSDATPPIDLFTSSRLVCLLADVMEFVDLIFPPYKFSLVFEACTSINRNENLYGKKDKGKPPNEFVIDLFIWCIEEATKLLKTEYGSSGNCVQLRINRERMTRVKRPHTASSVSTKLTEVKEFTFLRAFKLIEQAVIFTRSEKEQVEYQEADQTSSFS